MANNDNIVFDTNLLRNTTPREFFGSLQESMGQSLVVLPTVYRELEVQIPNEINRIWKRRLTSMREYQSSNQQYHKILSVAVKASLAWLRNICSDNKSIIKLIDPENTYEADIPDIADSIPDNCFKYFTDPQQADNDRRIVAETLLYNAHMIGSNNLRSMNHLTINKWALNTFSDRSEPLIVTGDEATHYMMPQPGLSGANWLYHGFLGVALPDGVSDTVSSIDRYLKRLEKDVLLPTTVARIREALSLDTDTLNTFEYFRANRPEKTRYTEGTLYQSTLQAAQNEGYDINISSSR